MKSAPSPTDVQPPGPQRRHSYVTPGDGNVQRPESPRRVSPTNASPATPGGVRLASVSRPTTADSAPAAEVVPPPEVAVTRTPSRRPTSASASVYVPPAAASTQPGPITVASAGQRSHS